MSEYLRGDFFVERIRQVSVSAMASAALQKINTQQVAVNDNGLDYCVRVVDSLQRKSEQLQQRIDQKPVEFNPFLPYEPQLYVGELSPTHRCLLNKFQVVDEHILIVTTQFRDQREILNRDDFAAAGIAMAARPSLLFYNGGREAGASVKHKHLQAIPITSGITLPLIDRFRAILNNAETFNPIVPAALPFRAAIATLPSLRRANRFDQHCHALYCEMLNLLQIACDDAGRVPPYNLLMTGDLLCLVPRRQEAFNGLNVNALGFAGTLLLKNAQQLAQLQSVGVEELLRQVGYPQAKQKS